MNGEFLRAQAQLEAYLDGALALLPKVAFAALCLFLFITLGRFARRWVTRGLVRLHRSPNLVIMLSRLAQVALVTVGVLVALSVIVPSFRAGDLIQLLGISGVAVGFAFKDILQNFLAGTILLLSEPFRIGDTITVAGFHGEVRDIQIRATILAGTEGDTIVVPNATVFTNPVSVTRPSGTLAGSKR